MNGLIDAARRLRRRVIPRHWHPYYRAEQSLLKWSNRKVMAGPFAGQVSIVDLRADYIDPEMLVGVYECELNDIVERIIAAAFDTFVDVGAGQGYYLVGIARRCPQTRIIGFDANPDQIQRAVRAAAANGVLDRIEFHGGCSPAVLETTLATAGRACVLVDVDGYERELLNPEVVGTLKHVALLVEEHSYLTPGVLDLLRQRFEPTHCIEVISSRLRTIADLPSGYQTRWHVLNMNRRSAEQAWLYMTPLVGCDPVDGRAKTILTAAML